MSEEILKKRIVLKKNARILLKESDGNNIHEFHITRIVSEEGSSAICYEAYHEKSAKGILKEFYPIDVHALKRTKEGQLVYAEETDIETGWCEQKKKEYLKVYEILKEEKRKDKSQELATFIPNFTIYQGCDEQGNLTGSIYVWCEEPKRQTFESICKEIHKAPQKEPEYKLVLVLKAMESLTKCLCILHRAGLIHRDIKPSNFGFIKRGKEIQTETLSLFDINSVCSVYDPPKTALGSVGYMEREARYKYVSNQTDIYSIGASLFHAIAVSDAMKKRGYLYDASLYEELRTIVDDSLLIQASESNSHPRLRSILTTILEKCLADREKRYRDCEELLEDLEEALYYVLPSQIAKKKRAGDRWVLKEIEKSLDTNEEKNSKLAMQYHLYQNPIYRWGKEDSDTFDVMIIGFGNYGQKFLDICLQIGQIPGKTLNVTVVSAEKTDWDIYLKGRPELTGFFNVDHSLKKTEQSYGNIDFETREFSRDRKEENTKILRELLHTQYKNEAKRTPQYIFLALGEDELNKSAAKACKEVIEGFRFSCCVNYVVEGKRNSLKKETNGMFPVYVSERTEEFLPYKDIERMAFNTHLVWEKGLNLNYSTVRKEFREPYNHDACISYVLAIKYKLFSIGIDLDQESFEQAAERFAERNVDTLIWAEHKRWVVEKICNGWTRFSDLKECLNSGTKDKKKKRHICLVRSNIAQTLTEEFWKNNHCEKWDNASKQELDLLDELDRMSVDLHRCYVEKARAVRKENPLHGNHMAELRRLVEDQEEAFVSFQEWYSCLKDIWGGERAKVKLYKGLKETLLASVKGVSEKYQKAVKAQIEAFETLFYPILASMEYRDYKQDDVALVENIPFILTYTNDLYLAVPYQTGDNTRLFSNVAAATVAGPASILYLCYLETEKDLREIRESLPYLANYMEKKKFRAAVEFVLAYSKEAAPCMDSGISYEFRNLSGGRVRRVVMQDISEEQELPDRLLNYLKRRKEGKHLFLVENNSAPLSIRLRSAGLLDEFDTYTFSSETMHFQGEKRGKSLSYIKGKSYIRVSDMLSLTRSLSKSSNQPEFYADYEDLWKAYQKDKRTWKQLCETLSEYAKQKDVIVGFKKKALKTERPMKWRYLLPLSCYPALVKILKDMKEYKAAGKNSQVRVYTSDSCEVLIEDRCGYENEYDRLFSNVYALMDPDTIQSYETPEKELKIVFDDLHVNSVVLDLNRMRSMVWLLEYFEQKGYIHHVQKKMETVSFTYATRKIKELLTNEGKMLEVYVYHKVKEEGFFDDVESSYEVNWESRAVKNEFDCILVKGFQSLFVECKARKNIEQEFYFRIEKLTEQFGINAKAVLIVDTEENKYPNRKKENQIQRMRGEKLGVITIWKAEEIEEIGHTLVQIMNGTYKEKEESRRNSHEGV